MSQRVASIMVRTVPDGEEVTYEDGEANDFHISENGMLLLKKVTPVEDNSLQRIVAAFNAMGWMSVDVEWVEEDEPAQD